ncbi:MAG: hypothetical protein WC821_00590 [archaeon]|jgi:ABC-type polysaccharide/polyol phosphate export permease
MKNFIKDLKIAIKLAKINLKTSIEGTYLGIIWYLLDPILFFLMIIFVRSFIKGADFAQYPLYLITGLIIYNYFVNSTSKMINFSKSSSNYAKNSNLSYNCIFLGKFFQSAYLHLFEIIVLIIFALFFNGSLLGILAYILIIFFFFSILNMGVSFIILVIGAYFPDFSNIWHLFTRLLRFVMPIFFIFEEKSFLYTLNLFNPVFYFLQITRDLVLFSKISDPFFIIVAFSSAIIIFIIGYLMFKKYNKYFPELAE